MKRSFALLVAGFLIAGLVAIFFMRPLTGSQDWAAWVQALGSILAIIGAFLVADQQHKKAVQLARETDYIKLNRKYDALKAIVDHAGYLTEMACSQLIDEGSAAGYMLTKYRPIDFDEADSALSSIPLHELGSYDLVVCIQRMKDALRGIRRVLDIAIKDPFFERSQHSDAASYAEELREQALGARLEVKRIVSQKF